MSTGPADRLHGLRQRLRVRAGVPLPDALQEAVLGGPGRYTRREVAEGAGLEVEEGTRLWRALGFPEAADDDRFLTRRDLEAARLMAHLTEIGVLEEDVRVAVARAVAQSMSRLAEWQVGMLARMVEAHPGDLAAVSDADALRLATEVVPALEKLQDYVWRRHLAATVQRLFVTGPADEESTQRLAVGFADMVGFTRATRRRSTAELSEMIERFGASTGEVIAEGRGRIVKTIGDEVLFVADDVADAAEIALCLQERVATEPALPELRIGLAAGPVLTRFGDVYGEVVNIASRLTSHARPGAVLVDREVAAELVDDPRYRLRPRRVRHVRGYRHLQP